MSIVSENIKINTDSINEQKEVDQNNLNKIELHSDNTGVNEYRTVDNTKYSQEIIDGARAAYNMEALEELKNNQDLTAFYDEGKKQILSQWHADQALNVHTDLFRVYFQINVGNILNVVGPTFKKKSDYTKWVKDNFKNNHIRYFQQAKQLALMGDFALDYAAAGKNRLLSLEHLRQVEKRAECEALFENYPLPDMAEDEEGQLLKRQIDAVITLHRLHNADISFATFDQSKLLASYDNEAIGVKKAAEIKTWLSQHPEDQQATLLAGYIQDQMTYPSEHPYTPAPKASLDKVLADLLNCYGNENLQDEVWIARQRELNILDSLLSAQQLIAQLIERLGVNAPVVEASAKTVTEI